MLIFELFDIIRNKTTPNQRKILFLLCGSYGITAVHYVGYPLWY
jgi:hypothetical protein